MARRLPSTQALLAFEAAARHLNFTRAAKELRLSQTAISHQIKTLERALRCQLFSREPHGLRLTEMGREYLRRIRPALIEIAEATENAKDHSDESALVVASLGNFSVKCLLPRLEEFRRLHRKITLKLVIVDSFDRVDPGAFDVGFRYGFGDWPGMQVDRVTHEEAFPVCSPRLLANELQLKTPRDLLSQTLIRLDSPMLGDFWVEWLEAAGIKGADISEEIRCNRLSTSIQAAINGIGVTIARSSVVQPDLDAGLLLEPFDLRVSTGREGYFLVSTPDKAKSEKVSVFRTWAIETLRKERV